ncbi:MAG TPA: CBS domain-containing protein, partial [Spirochaetales bacterium]|nr:CBS domain-containing protein [Spirochaetales bacterium]
MDSIPLDTDGGPKVVLDLIYRLKVADVMSADVRWATPLDSLRHVQELMREHGITGVPIMDGGRLAGIVTIGDIIEALDGGHIDERAGSRMSTGLTVLEADMPLSFAITYLNRYHYRRFPVLNRDGSLVGIVTATDIIRALLVEMNREVERLEEGIAKASPAADPAAGPRILRFTTRRFDFENAGRASAELKKALKIAGADPQTVRRAAVASYELELNQVIHSHGGVMEFRLADGRVGSFLVEYARSHGDDAKVSAKVTPEPWFPLKSGAGPVTAVSYGDSGSGRIIVAKRGAGADSTTTVLRLAMKRGLIGAGKLSALGEVEITTELGAEPLILRASQNGSMVLAACANGEIDYFLANGAEVTKRQSFSPFDGEVPRQMDYLFGGVSIIVTGPGGEQEQWSLFRESEDAERMFGLTKSFPPLGEGDVLFAASQRNRTFLTGAGRQLSIRH